MKGADFMFRPLRLLVVGLLIIFASGCAASDVQGSSPTSYQETKKMVIDLLKSDEGKTAIKDILNDPSIKQEIVMKQDFVKSTIESTLASDKGKEYWTSLIEDTDFSNKLAKTMQKQDEKVLQQLMKDPTYQKNMMSILKSPDMEKNYLELMKTEPYRKQMKQVIIDTMSSPLFATQLSDALKKAVEDVIKKDAQQQKGKGQGGGGGQSGGSGGGGGK